MNKKYHATILVAGVFVCLAGGMLVNRFATAQTAQSVPASHKTEAQKWEYCAVTDISYISGDLSGAYSRVIVVYSGDPGNRVEIKVAATLDAVMVTASKLGADGWEMIGQTTRDAGGYNVNYPYFKRPAK